MAKKYIPVKLTPDAELNREALGPEVMGVIEKLQRLGPLRLCNVKVEQGSDAAERVAEAQRKWKERNT